MPKKSRPRKIPARRNPFAALARAIRVRVIPSRKIYRRKAKHSKKGAGGAGG
jgi:hypothetical protein